MRTGSQTRRHFLKTAGTVSSSMTFSDKNFGSQTAVADTTDQTQHLRTYTGLLRLYNEFDFSLDKQSPKFQYDFSHPELDRLRESYKLDQIAGTGD